jgi:HAD superfamily hydrolase (TIGR01490 family)
VIQRTSPAGAAFFDLDKTLIARNSATALISTLIAEGMLRRRTVLRSIYAQASYQLGAANRSQSERLKQVLGSVISGWDAARLALLAHERLPDKIAPQVFSQAAALVKQHHDAGRDVVIVSASSRELVEPIGALLGADHCLSSRMEVQNGYYTGQAEFFNYGAAKVESMMRLAASVGYDLGASYAYSDSVTDLPMLEAVGHAAVVNPSRAFRQLAEERGWQVIRFSQPASVRSQNHRLALSASLALLLPAMAGIVLCHSLKAWRRRTLRAGRTNTVPLVGSR